MASEAMKGCPGEKGTNKEAEQKVNTKNTCPTVLVRLSIGKKTNLRQNALKKPVYLIPVAHPLGQDLLQATYRALLQPGVFSGEEHLLRLSVYAKALPSVPSISRPTHRQQPQK